MSAHISLITLGVADVDRAREFYERLGWQVGLALEDTAFFEVGGMILSLWGRDQLAADSGVTDTGGRGGVALAPGGAGSR